MARLALLLSLLVLLAPAEALAQGPFSPIPPAPPQQTAPPEEPDDGTSRSADEDEGLSERTQVLIGLGGAIMLLGIASYIVRDARRNAPVEHHLSAEEGGTASKGTRTPKQQRVSRQRAAAKRARQQRKKNR